VSAVIKVGAECHARRLRTAKKVGVQSIRESMTFSG
jgi:hypothetical protein